MGADGERALLGHDGREAVGREAFVDRKFDVVSDAVGLGIVPEVPFVRALCAAVEVGALGALHHRPALVRRVVRVHAVVGPNRVALDQDALGLPQSSQAD
eukprot:COSAG04_NODE_697_length_11055_cov_5.640471_11_plen_100_part_00